MILSIISHHLPMTIFTLSGLIWITAILGANSLNSVREEEIVSSITSMISLRPMYACAIVSLMIFIVRPHTFVSNWIAVIPSLDPATLKSISPIKSSVPIKSVNILYSVIFQSSSCLLISPIAIPETGAKRGTQAAISERVDPQVAPIEVDQPEARQSLITLIV